MRSCLCVHACVCTVRAAMHSIRWAGYGGGN